MTIIWAGLIFVGSSIQGPALPEAPSTLSYIVHFVEYAVLGALLLLSWLKHKTENLKRKTTTQNLKLFFYIFVIGSLYAISDEVHQLYVPGRNFDWVDLAVDAVGLILGIGLIIIIKRNKTATEISHGSARK